jgi:hypothetical protein
LEINLLELAPEKLRYLECLFDHEQAGTDCDSSEFLMERCGLSLAAALGLTRALDGYGFVQETNAMGSPSAILADAGRDAVIRLREFRANPAYRREAARDGLLARVHDAHQQGVGNLDPASTAETRFAQFYGDVLTASEFVRAADYLAEKGLLTVGQRNADGIPMYVDITAAGEDCVDQADGDVAKYLRAVNPPSGTTYHTTIGAVAGGNNFAIGNQGNVSQVGDAGIDPAALRELVTLLLPEFSRFGDAEPQAREAAEEIAEEANSSRPDRGRVGGAIARIRDLAIAAGAHLVVAAVTYQAQKAGVLPPDPPPLPSAP